MYRSYPLRYRVSHVYNWDVLWFRTYNQGESLNIILSRSKKALLYGYLSSLFQGRLRNLSFPKENKVKLFLAYRSTRRVGGIFNICRRKKWISSLRISKRSSRISRKYSIIGPFKSYDRLLSTIFHFNTLKYIKNRNNLPHGRCRLISSELLRGIRYEKSGWFTGVSWCAKRLLVFFMQGLGDGQHFRRLCLILRSFVHLSRNISGIIICCSGVNFPGERATQQYWSMAPKRGSPHMVWPATSQLRSAYCKEIRWIDYDRDTLVTKAGVIRCQLWVFYKSLYADFN